MGAEGRLTATARYAWSSVAAEFEDYYLELRGERGPSHRPRPVPDAGRNARRPRTSDRMPVVARLASTWLPPLVWMAVIFAFSSLHGGGHLPAAEVVLRKLAHVTEYFVLTALVLRALRRSQVAAAGVVAVGAAFAYAASDEWHQSFVPGRTATARDVAIDGIGIALAALAVTRSRLRERIA